MSKLKNKKYVGLLLIVVLVVGIISLISFGKVDKYSGLVKVKDSSIKTKLLSSTGAILDSNNVQGNSTVEYTVSFTLEELEGVERRTAVIKGSLTEEENRYARFKRIEGTGITSTLSNGGKDIEVQIENVPLGVEKQVKLKVILENAPNNYSIRPTITVQERTGEDKTISVEEIVVSTNSIEGTVTDENGLEVSNIEVVARKNGNEVRRAYTDDYGKYLITDLEVGTYEIDVDEEVYEVVDKTSKEVEESTVLDLRVKSVAPYTIETHKYIESLHLIVDGVEKDYTYQDAEKVVEEIKRANTISGEIEYKLVVTNTGEKAGVVTRVLDSTNEGLKLIPDKNVGWEEIDNVYYYRPIEGVTLEAGETREFSLYLDIESTNEAKTYINKMTAKGELYERVVFILDGSLYREEDVLFGETVDEIIIESENFSGWYTDANMTNKYKFSLPVTKDLILYGKMDRPQCTVTFMDFGNVYDRQTIDCGTKATRPVDPVHPGYEFDTWLDDNDYEFDENEPIEYDVTYTSKNDLIRYKIKYHGLTEAEETALHNPIEYTIESDTITLANPNNRVDGDGDPSEAFIGWTTPDVSNPSMSASIPHGSIGDRDFTANWTPIAPDEYRITYDLQGGALEEGKSNPNTYTKLTPTFTLNNPVKNGYDFVGWTGTDLTEATETVTIPQGSRGDRAYVAVYTPTIYRITYHLEGGSLPEGVTNPTTYTIESPDITLNNPSMEGYTFKGWTGSNGNVPQTTTILPTGSTGDKEYTANYEINKYTVIYMDGDNQFGIETVNHGSFATAPNPSPSKEHNIFLGWTLNGVPYVFSTPVTSDLTLYSSYELVEPPVITHTPTGWTNQNVTVSITSDHNDYTYMYNIDGGSYRQYTGPFEVEENCTITSYSVKQSVNSVSVSHVVDNIDKIKPRITSLEKTSGSYTSFTVELNGYDSESGLKQFDLYIDNVYETSFYYNSNYNDPKTATYTFTGLQPSTTYKIGVEAHDVATNISDRFEKNIETDYLVVARIIGEDNQLWDPEDYIEFGTLRAAIEYPDCVSTQCTIQMLQSVNESNEILQGQDITLDLNGKTVAGIKEYTMLNDGEFTLIDDAAEPGQLYNAYDTAIINENGGVLTLGVDEDPQDVKLTTPVVIAKEMGIYTDDDSIFNYYDGMSQGRIAIQGNVDRTPYLYNADVTVADQIQTSSLQKLVDAEARIKSTYYTRVHDAVDDAKYGTKEEYEAEVSYIEDVKNPTTYGFKYENGVLVNEGSPANGYLQIDMTEEAVPKTVEVNLTISGTSADKAYGKVKTTIGTPTFISGDTSNMFEYSGEGTYTATTTLYPGNNYYLYLNFQQGSENGSVSINSISIGNSLNIVGPADFELFTRNEYPFVVNPDGSIESTNTGYVAEMSFSKFDIDLTDAANDKYFFYSLRINNDDGVNSSSTLKIVNENNSSVLNTTLARNVENTYVKLPKGHKYTFTLAYSNANSSYSSPTINNTETVSMYNYYLREFTSVSPTTYTVNPSYNNHNITGTSSITVGGVKSSVGTNQTTDIYYNFDNTSSTTDKELFITGTFRVAPDGDTNTSTGGIYLTDDTSYSTTGKVFEANYSNSLPRTVSSTISYFATVPAGENKYLHCDLTSDNTSSYQYLTISSLSYSDSKEYINVNLYGTTYNNFELNETDGVIGTPKDSYSSYAISALKFDLTDSAEDKLIFISGIPAGSLSSQALLMYASPEPFKSSAVIQPYAEYGDGRFYLLPAGQVTYISLEGRFGLWCIDSNCRQTKDFQEFNIESIYEVELTTDDKHSSYETTKKRIILNEDPDTVEILKDITLSNKIDIIEEKNMILDLNGFSLNNNTDDYMITNNGSLKITDSAYDRAYDELVIEAEAMRQEIAEIYDEYKDKTTADLEDYVQDELFVQYDAYYGNGGQTGVTLADVKGNNTDVSFYGPTYPQYGYMELYNGNFNIGSSNKFTFDGSFTVQNTYNKRENGYSNYSLCASGYFGTYCFYNAYDGRSYIYGPSMDNFDYNAPSVNELHNYAMSYDADALTMTFYIDGIAVHQEKLASPLETRNVYFYMSGSSVPVDVYDFSVYKKALSQKEIAQNYYTSMARYGNRVDLNQATSYGPDSEGYIIDGNMETYYESSTSITQTYTLPNPLTMTRVKFYFDTEASMPASINMVGSRNNQSNSELLFTKLKPDIDANGVLEVEIPTPSAYVKYQINISADEDQAFRLKEVEYEVTGKPIEMIEPVIDTSSIDKKRFTSNDQAVIYNAPGAVLEIENVKLVNTSSSSNTVIDNYGTLTLGNESYLESSNGIGVDNHEEALLYFDGGKINTYIGINNSSMKQTSFDNAYIAANSAIINQNSEKALVFRDSVLMGTNYDVNIYGSVTLINTKAFDTSRLGIISGQLKSINSTVYAKCSNVDLTDSYYYSPTYSYNAFTSNNSEVNINNSSLYFNSNSPFYSINSTFRPAGSNSYTVVELYTPAGSYIENSNFENTCMRLNDSYATHVIKDTRIGCTSNYVTYGLYQGAKQLFLLGDNIIGGLQNSYRTEIDGKLTMTRNISNESYATAPDRGMYVRGDIVFDASGAHFNNYGYLEFSGNSSITSTSKQSSPAVVGSSSESTCITVFKDAFEMKDNNFSNAFAGSGKLIVGENDGNVRINSPVLRSYGMTLSTGSIYFYDGTIIGPRNSTYGNIVETEAGYVVKKEYDENDIEYVTLTNEAVTDVAQIGETKYTSLQEAFNAVPTDGTLTTIEIIGNISTSLRATLQANQNVVININNHSINTSNYPYITNNGTMKLVDSNPTNPIKTTIVNNGTLTLDDVYLVASSKDAIRNLEGSTLNVTNGSNVSTIVSKTVNSNPELEVVTNSTINVTDSTVNSINYGTVTLTNSTASVGEAESLTATNSTMNTAGAKVLSITGSTIGTVGLEYQGTGTITNSDITTVSNSGTLTISGGTVTTIDNKNSLTLTDNVSVSCDNTCINNKSTLNLVSGTVTTSSLEVSTITNTGTINLGTKGDKDEHDVPIVSVTNPMVESTRYAIAGNGRINFYDGILKSLTKPEVIEGSFNEIEDRYSVVYDSVSGTRVVYLDYVPVARIESTGALYYDFKEALEAVNAENDTVTLLKNVELSSSYPTANIASDKKFTLDMNGMYIDHTNNNLFINNGDLTIVGGSPLSRDIYSHNGSVFTNNGTLTLNNINLSFDGSISMTNTGTLNINDSSIKNTVIVDPTAYVISKSEVYDNTNTINNTGILNIDSTTLTSNIINSDDNTTTTFTDVTMQCYTSRTCITNKGDMTIDGGTYYMRGLEGDDYHRNIPGSFIDNMGNLEIDDSNITIRSNDFINNWTNVVIDGGSYSFLLARGYNQNVFFAEINGGNVTVKDGDFYLISFSPDNLTLESGNYYGIKINYIQESGSITLGVKDGVVSTTSPRLEETDVTVVNNVLGGTFNFYDGIIIGPNDKERYDGEIMKPINGLVSDIETGYYIFKDIDGDVQSKYLSNDPIVRLSSNNQEYRTLAEAVAAATSGDTISYIRDLTIHSSDATTVVNKDVTIDLNGMTIDSDALMIDNTANTTITNSKSTGMIKFYDTTRNSITNSGTLTIENINIEGRVFNESTLNINNSTITSVVNTNITNVGGINSSLLINSGALTLTNNTTNRIDKITDNGTISGYGLYNKELNSNGTINITNSELEKASMNDATITDSIIGATGVKNIVGTNISGALTVSDSAILDNFSGGLTNRSTNIQITNSNFELDNSGNITVDNTNTLTGLTNSGVATIDGVTSGNIKNYGTLNIIRSTINGSINSNNVLNYEQSTTSGTVTNSGEFNMISGSITSSSEGIINSGKLILGVRDGSVDPASPSISGTTGVSGNVTAFYDGIVTGTTDSISGVALVQEDTYELKKDEDQGLYRAYLTQTPEGISRVAVVNNINYTSLQGAIDACASTSCDIILYANIELDEPVTVQAGADINIYLNYRSIVPESYVTNHSGTGNIRIISGIPSGISGAIYKFFANILGTELNPRNIIVYNMDDGNKLLTEETYKLYKLMDGQYKIVEFDEEEIGNYTVGNDTEIMNVIKGKLYLNGLGDGSYKLVSNTNRELDFEITETGISNNIRINTNSQSAKVTSSAVATLILAFSTGIVRIPYILIMLLIVVALACLLILINRKRVKESK